MTRQEVASSNIKSVGYDAKEKILEVEFSSGSVYRYSDIPEDVYNALMAADSKGTFFYHAVKMKYSGKLQ